MHKVSWILILQNTVTLSFCIVKCEDIFDVFEMPLNYTRSEGVILYFNYEVIKYTKALVHRQYNSLQSCLHRLVLNKLSWGFCLENPEVFRSFHNRIKTASISGPCGNIYVLEDAARKNVRWLLKMPHNADFNLTFIRFSIHFSGSLCIFNRLTIYKQRTRSLHFGNFCGRIPQFSTYIEGSRLLIHLDCDTLEWNVDVKMIYQLHSGIYVSSGLVYKIYPLVNEKVLEFKNILNQPFVTNREESIYIWQFKIENKRKEADPVYEIILTCDKSFANRSYFAFSSGPYHLKLFEKITYCELDKSYRKYKTTIPVISLKLFITNTDILRVAFRAYAEINQLMSSMKLDSACNRNNRNLKISISSTYLFSVGENSDIACKYERVTFSLSESLDAFKYIQIQLVINMMDSYQFDGCNYGSIAVEMEAVSPIEICSTWPKLMNKNNITFISTTTDITLILLSLYGMFKVKGEVIVSPSDCKGAFFPSEILYENRNSDGVRKDRTKYRYITSKRKRLFLEIMSKSCVVMHIFPSDEWDRNLSSTNRKYEIHVTTHIRNDKEIPLKPHNLVVNYFIPRMKLNGDDSIECENFGYVYSEGKFEKNYNFIAGYDKDITFSASSLYTVLDIREGCNFLGFQITIMIASADSLHSSLEMGK